MKLWKIMLAALICVLMLSVVASAEHNHNFVKIEGSQENSNFSSYVANGVHMHRYLRSWETRCEGCGAESSDSTWIDQPCADYVEAGTYVPATCAANAYTPKTCTKCGASWKDEVTNSATGNHDWILGQYHYPTCQDYGYHTDVCAVCGKVEKKEDVNEGRRPHYYDDVTLVEGSCTTKKQTAKACIWCKDILEGSIVVGDKAGHDYAWTTTQQPTCTAKGIKTGVCKVCGDKGGYAEVPALGHKANYATEKTTWATCTTKGYKTADCAVCGVNFKYDEVKANGHDTVRVEAKEATCGRPGNFAYYYCKNCSVLWEGTGKIEIAEKPVIPANDKHILSYDKVANIKDCTASNNYAQGNCEICGEYTRVYVPAQAHVWPAALNKNATKDSAYQPATCTEAGKANFKCERCNEYRIATIPAEGHQFKTWTYSKAATCTTDLTATSTCWCGETSTKIIEEALGHNWILQEGSKDATCTEAGQGTRFCTRCKNTQQNVTIPAKGHNFSKVVETVKPTCDAQGYTVYGCANGCGETQKGSYTAALGHNYSWVVVTKPSEAGNGKNEYTCTVCKKVSDTKTVKYTKYYYNNTMTSFGPTTKELVGGNDWYRVTPVDVTVDGVYTYDLIASNKYVVGTVTISVNAGTLTVSYKVKGNVDVKDESLLIYASKADLAAGSAVTAPVGAAINVAETFGADGKVLVSLILTGDYDAAGKDLVNDAAAAGMIANID